MTMDQDQSTANKFSIHPTSCNPTKVAGATSAPRVFGALRRRDETHPCEFREIASLRR